MELSKTNKNYFPLNDLENSFTSVKKRFISQSLKAIPKLLACFVFTKAEYTGKQLLKLKQTLIKIKATFSHTKGQVLLEKS